VALPENWKEQLTRRKIVIGEIEQSESPTEATVLIATPVLSQKRDFLGLFATEASMDDLQTLMESIAVSQSTNLSLLNRDGSILNSNAQQQLVTTTLSEINILHKLHTHPMVLATYTRDESTKVVGVFAPLPHLSWGILMEKRYNLAFAEVLQLKNLTLTIIAMLLGFIGVSAFFLSYSILSPLKQLVTGAMRVAGGDLGVQLPVKNRDEIGFTITIFNDMVVQLRKNRDQLEQIAAVDSLTGLANRKNIMDTLAMHIKRYSRHKIPFSILMTDLDHFKRVNDTYGHLAGDAVLVKIGQIFNETLRSIDTAGRYGGEEFLIILDSAGEQEAKQTAERIRQAVERCEIITDGHTVKVTISIGIATTNNTINLNRNSGQLLIGMADKALYQAKKEGRNRVVLSSGSAYSQGTISRSR
jgi:diguanylate cyclase (GGDEF)-like protein